MSNALAVKVLAVTEYPPDPSHDPYETHSFPNPTWAQINSAIRALNHYCLPFINIGLDEMCEGDNCLSVMGGPNGYCIFEGDKLYFDPNHTGGEVDVWTSDQGFYPEERNVTYDIDLVLKLARYYAEHGELDPSVQWE
jgi:hypothetical protein